MQHADFMATSPHPNPPPPGGRGFIGTFAITSNTNRRLLIAEESGVPIGTIRADYSDGMFELSWTVAPNARGRGVGKIMVALLASQIVEPIRAEVYAGNEASMRIAEYAGMLYDREEENGLLHYRRTALK